MKKCCRCKNPKPISEFGKNRKQKDGLATRCRQCVKEVGQESYYRNQEKRLEKQRQAYLADPEDKKQRANNRYRNKREELKVKNNLYYHQNKEVVLEKQHIHYEENKSSILLKYKLKRKEYIIANLANSELYSPVRMSSTYKECYKCKKEGRLFLKTLNFFNRCLDSKDGLDKTCKDCRKLKHKEYYAVEENKQKVLINVGNRRALLARIPGSHTAREWLELRIKYNFTCLACGKKEPEISLCKDHIIPINDFKLHPESSACTNSIENLQPLCGPCNLAKFTEIIDYRFENKKIISMEE